MRIIGFDTLASAAGTLWAATRSSFSHLTLDQLRSDLSHEPAAKIARLSALVREWREGRFRPGDADDVEALMGDLERLYRRHAGLACARFGSFVRVAHILATLRDGKRQMRTLRNQLTPSTGDIESFARLVAVFSAQAPMLVEEVSRRHAARIADLAGIASQDIHRELGATEVRGGVRVAVDASGIGTSTWVPRADIASWTDLLRNVIRNAVQATEARRAELRGEAQLPDTVTVHVRPTRERAGTTLEVLDEGTGMSPDEVGAMWRSGQSTRGMDRGHGLTESKRRFLEERADFEVQSAQNVGTRVRIAVRPHEISIRVPRWWTTPPFVVMGLALLAVATVVMAHVAVPKIVRVEVDQHRIVRALDSRGALIWQRDLGAPVVTNFSSNVGPAGVGRWIGFSEHLILRGRWPWEDGVILATQPNQGPGSLWRLDARGRTQWERTLAWVPPLGKKSSRALCCYGEFAVPWNLDGRECLVLNVRDGNHSSTSIQFATQDGEPLGTYYHPGNLEFFVAADVDGDGATEVLLNGINNEAVGDRSFLAANQGENSFIECLVLLEPPNVGGQAFPYKTWPSMPPASEDGYLLFPPLRQGEWMKIDFIHLARPIAQKEQGIEVTIRDGRVYQLGSDLRPLRCTAGDNTPAARLAPTQAQGPLIYIHHGIREDIWLPVQRGHS